MANLGGNGQGPVTADLSVKRLKPVEASFIVHRIGHKITWHFPGPRCHTTDTQDIKLFTTHPFHQILSCHLPQWNCKNGRLSATLYPMYRPQRYFPKQKKKQKKHIMKIKVKEHIDMAAQIDVIFHIYCIDFSRFCKHQQLPLYQKNCEICSF